MSKTWVLVKREYLQRVKTKTFIISTVLGPLLMVGYIAFVVFITRLESGEERVIAVVHEQEEVARVIQERLSPDDSREAGKYTILSQARQGRSKEALLALLMRQVNDGTLHAFVYLPPDFLTAGEAEYYSKSVGNFLEVRALQRALSDLQMEKRLLSEGLDAGRIRQLIKPLRMKTVKVGKEGAEEDSESQLMAGFVAVFMQYMVILLYGIAVMRSVIEEKSSRMVEVLLSSVRPFQYMMGKIVGVGAAGLSQVLVWALCGLLLSLYGGAVYLAFMGEAAGASLPRIPFSMVVAFIVYFLLGYFLYATLYAAIGSAVNSEQEAQHMQVPVTILVVVPVLLVSFVMRAPESLLATTLSLIPLFTPVLMFMRLCVLPPPAWQIALSIVLTLAFSLLVVWAAGRIYRIGILMYGKKPTLPELLRWVSTS